VTAFVIVCAAMLAAALSWILVPLWRTRTEESTNRTERGVATAIVAVLLPLLAVTLYATLSNWSWDPAKRQSAQVSEVDQVLRQIEARAKERPDDFESWLLLGRAYVEVGRPADAVAAFERANALTGGGNPDALVGLAEALVLSDRSALGGRAGELLEEALGIAPNHPKALFYSAMAAMQEGKLELSRDRLQLLVAQNPPPEVRSILQRQIDDLNEQLSVAGAPSQSAGAGTGRTIDVSITIAPHIQQQLDTELPLFVLARDPAGGPPLAVQRLSSADLPRTVRLSERDAMMPSRTLASVPRVEVVARLSRSGSPQAQSGDFFGQAELDFGKGSTSLNIIIDQVVP
jgi:cytochrome c-type biogenesis protein CcmH